MKRACLAKSPKRMNIVMRVLSGLLKINFVRMKCMGLMLVVVLCLSQFAYSQDKKINKVPKNIIVFIADGGGYNQMRVTNHYLYGADDVPMLDTFGVRLAMSTYAASKYEEGAVAYDPVMFWSDFSYAKKGFTESAAAATALACGFKSRNGRIGTDVNGNPVSNVSEMAKSCNKSVGIVTSVPVSHATPAGYSAHQPSRKLYGDIFLDQIFNSRVDVLIGAGHPLYDEGGNLTGKPDYSYVYSESLFKALKTDTLRYFAYKDNLLMVQDIGTDHKPDCWSFSDEKKRFAEIASGKNIPKRFLGLLPVATTISEKRAGSSKLPGDVSVSSNIPTLAMSSLAALQVVSQNKNGFFMMIEGGAIDWANHDNKLPRLVEEYSSFYNSIDTVMSFLKAKGMLDETLIIVTSDHECGYLWGTGKPFSMPEMKGKGQLDEMTYYSTNHSNSLVPFYASGPGSGLFFYEADELDSVRGAYLTNSDLAKVLKSMLNNTPVVYPALISAKQGSVVLTCAANLPGVTIQWRCNGVDIPGKTGYKLLLSKDMLKKGTIYDAVLRSGNNHFVSNGSVVID